MYNKILIISDNLHLCSEVKNLFLKHKKENLSVSFSISPFSDKLIFSNQLNQSIQVFDMKNTHDINHILNNYDLIISIHCKQIFPSKIINNIKCINVHPGYNPINRGWYPQVFAIHKNLLVGATIHEIDNQLDHGNIIARAFVEKEITDTSETLYNKIVKKEIELLNMSLESIIENNYQSFKPENEGELYLKKDFRDLCELNLNERSTTTQFINRLRALTHGEFKNAFFIDPSTGKKIYVSINLSSE